MSGSFQPGARERDQAAGIVWLYQDPENYGVVRANALVDNVVLYKVEQGEQIPLEPNGTPSMTCGVKHRVPKGEWSDLRVDFTADHFHVYFGGVGIMDVHQTTFAKRTLDERRQANLFRFRPGSREPQMS